MIKIDVIVSSLLSSNVLQLLSMLTALSSSHQSAIEDGCTQPLAVTGSVLVCKMFATFLLFLQ